MTKTRAAPAVPPASRQQRPRSRRQERRPRRRPKRAANGRTPAGRKARQEGSTHETRRQTRVGKESRAEAQARRVAKKSARASGAPGPGHPRRGNAWPRSPPARDRSRLHRGRCWKYGAAGPPLRRREPGFRVCVDRGRPAGIDRQRQRDLRASTRWLFGLAPQAIVAASDAGIARLRLRRRR